MAEQVATDTQTGRILHGIGWRQGSTFRLEGATVYANDVSLDSNAPKHNVHTKPVASKHLLVVVSQECDIVAKDYEEPYIEALVCRKAKERRIAQIQNRTARYFALPEASLEIVAPYRVLVKKTALLNITPEQWPGTGESLELFVRWLAARFDRPAVPDELVDLFDRPIRDLFSAMATEEEGALKAFNTSVREIRVTPPLTDKPPFEIYITLLLASEDGLTIEQVSSIQHVYNRMCNCVNPEMIKLNEDPNITTAGTMSVAEYEAGRTLALEFVSYEGDTPNGAIPIRRTG